MTPLIKWFNELRISDISLVGGKNASLGQMITELKPHVAIPDGFAVTTHAYWLYIDTHHLRKPIHKLLQSIRSANDTVHIMRVSKRIRALIRRHTLPDQLSQAITQACHQLCGTPSCGINHCPVAVRSSATAEDLPTASFAGVHESFLNVRGTTAVLNACHACFASLFTPRAIAYRLTHAIAHETVALSVGIQRMVRSDQACAGVAFTLDPETGFREVVMVNAAYGLGESVVKGAVIPDTMYVHKPTLAKGFAPVLSKIVGNKKTKLIYQAHGGTKAMHVPLSQRERFCLSDHELLTLARMCVHIEDHYTQLNHTWTPMDIEWAKDGIDGKLYVVQARPETVHVHKNQATHTLYCLKKSTHAKRTALLAGQAIGQCIVHGTAKRISSPQQGMRIKTGDIIITHMTNPDWVPLLKKASGLVTDLGGRTCHAAIVSRELGIPAIIGTQCATQKLVNNQVITLDCSQGETGIVYQGAIPFTSKMIAIHTLPKPEVSIMLNISQPDKACTRAYLPVDGVGLARTEFIIANTINIHPLALLHPQKTDQATRAHIKHACAAYASYKQYFIDILAQEISMIAAAFWPKPVLVRLSDFKSSEYRNLMGGCFFEPPEDNPMLGLRGASRYYSTRYHEAFALECAAIYYARTHKGLDNIHIMLPFVRTVNELKKIATLLERHTLKRTESLRHVMMCEIPSNALLIEQFAPYVDGFSIGSNDLTQLTLGVDRDEPAVAHLFDEQNQAVKDLISLAITGAHRAHKTISICGQAPSDHPLFAQWLIEQGIDALSLNADAIIPLLLSGQLQRS